MLKTSKDSFTSILVWVRFYNIPFEFGDAEWLSVIGIKVGKSLYAHSPTLKCTRDPRLGCPMLEFVLRLRLPSSYLTVSPFNVNGKCVRLVLNTKC